MKFKLFVLATLLLLNTSAFAVFDCTVKVKQILVYKNGSVNIMHSGRNSYTYICDLDGDYQGVATTTCAMWVSLLQQSKSNNEDVRFYYDGTGSCATLPTYGSAPAPVYIGQI